MKSFAAAAAASLCALAPASAFVPGGALPIAGTRSSSSKLSMATPERSISIPIDPYPEGLDGEMVGDVGFDPAGFANNPPAWVQGPGTGTAARVRWYREAELAHCRVAMLAALGWIFPEIYHFPGNSVLGPDRFAEMNPLLAYDNIPNAGGIQIVVTLLILETIRLNKSIRNPDGVPGDIGLGQGEGRWNPFNFNYTEEEYKEKQLQVREEGRQHVRLAAGRCPSACVCVFFWPFFFIMIHLLSSFSASHETCTHHHMHHYRAITKFQHAFEGACLRGGRQPHMSVQF